MVKKRAGQDESLRQRAAERRRGLGPLKDTTNTGAGGGVLVKRNSKPGGADSLEERLAIARAQVLWLGSLLPRLLTTPNGSQRLPTAPYDYKHTLLSASNDSHGLPATSTT